MECENLSLHLGTAQGTYNIALEAISEYQDGNRHGPRWGGLQGGFRPWPEECYTICGQRDFTDMLDRLPHMSEFLCVCTVLWSRRGSAAPATSSSGFEISTGFVG